MSDIKLTRPSPSSVVTVEPRKGDSFDIVFDAGEAVLSKENASLVFTFEDGAQVVLANFYEVYSKEEMPSFSFGDIAVTGEEFFTAQNASGGGRWSDYGNSALLDGIGRLGVLDIGMDSEMKRTEDLYSVGRADDDGSEGFEDEEGEVRVAITAQDSQEGGGSAVAFAIQLSAPPSGEAVAHVLVNGTTYDVPLDEHGAGSLAVSTGNGEDVYVDPSAITAKVVGVTGGNYENVVTGQTATAEVKDTIDDTTVSITASGIHEGDASVAFSVQLSNPPQGEASVQVEVGGKVHSVAVDASGKGVLTLDNANADDVYKDASSVTAKVVGVTGGNYEKVVTGQTATANVADTVNDTTVSITASDIQEGDASVAFSVQLSNAPDPAFEGAT
ncbi:MAG: hypothetical protein K6C33_09860, partial [Desulfovibrio sp.]|nr:hypothetical protein [Desulfovibrio sp.]